MKAGTPGPASYGIVKPSIYKRQTASAGFTIPSRGNQREYSTIKDNPGPGCYNTGDVGTTANQRLRLCNKMALVLVLSWSYILVFGLDLAALFFSRSWS